MRAGRARRTKPPAAGGPLRAGDRIRTPFDFPIAFGYH